MKVKIQKDSIQINLHELIDALSDEDRLDLIERLSCWDDVIAHVGDQLLDGWTVNGFHGGRGYAPLPFTPLDKMKREIAKRSGELAKKEIERLESTAVGAEKSRDEAWQKVSRLETRLFELERR